MSLFVSFSLKCFPTSVSVVPLYLSFYQQVKKQGQKVFQTDGILKIFYGVIESGK